MTSINAYLAFGGNCREAMTFYKNALGGELFMQTIEDSPMAKDTPKESWHKVMHASQKNKNIVLMASDLMNNTKFTVGTAVSLSLNCDTEEEVKKCFTNLSRGGKIIMPLSEQFWGALFGIFNDRYGICWMLNFDKPKQ